MFIIYLCDGQDSRVFIDVGSIFIDVGSIFIDVGSIFIVPKLQKNFHVWHVPTYAAIGTPHKETRKGVNPKIPTPNVWWGGNVPNQSV